MVFWTGKEEGKEKLEVGGGQIGLLPNFSFLSPPSPCVATKWWSGAHQRTRQCSRRARSARTTGARARASPRSHARSSAHGRDESEGLSRLKIPVVTDFPQPLCHNREFSATIEVSRSLVTTELSCHDKVCCWDWMAWVVTEVFSIATELFWPCITTMDCVATLQV